MKNKFQKKLMPKLHRQGFYFRTIIDKVEHPDIGATEMTFSNDMRICYKYTDFLDDQVFFTGFFYASLTELSEAEYTSCSMGSTIAVEISTFGYRPSVHACWQES